MYRRGDPRWNRTIQHLTDNLEHANETAQENLYGFTQRYVTPCFSSISSCCHTATSPCCPTSSDRRRSRARSRGRPELSFDFYDDWDADERDGLLGWGNDSLERFLGTNTTTYGTTPPMAYAPRTRDPRFDRRGSRTPKPPAAREDPTLIPSSSYFGFFGRLLAPRGLRYKPSAADLTEHPGRVFTPEAEPLLEDSEEDTKPTRRARSNTHTSGHTTDSLSSRGDIFPSEDELDDAVPLDDEFTIALERRTTAQWDEGSGGKTRSNSKRPSRSASSRTVSSAQRSEDLERSIIEEGPTLDELAREEERIRAEEETEVERKREVAREIAVRKGLAGEPKEEDPSKEEDVNDFKRLGTTPPGIGEDRHADDDDDDVERPVTAIRKTDTDTDFIPARLPNFQ